jgi:hypothetical protein
MSLEEAKTINKYALHLLPRFFVTFRLQITVLPGSLHARAQPAEQEAHSVQGQQVLGARPAAAAVF